MAEERPGLTPPPPSGSEPAPHDPARARFYFIAAHRVVGAVLIALGMLAMQGALDWGEGVGKVLAIVGLIDFFLIPLVLARMWKSMPK
ncbi:MAG TPA: hypothetical protein VFS87_03070 [Qipengyuania sp.]|nr:hypothetical protein [Qipengyuania sp.]